MKTDLDIAKDDFCKLEAEHPNSEHERMIRLLLSLRENVNLTPDDMGWVLWNICDRYAMARDSIAQQNYQSEFFELVKCSFPERAHWVVCDGTQANGQIRGGFLDFWSDCYQFANNNAPCVAENRGARFQAHSANASSYMKFGETSRAESALEAMARLIGEDSQWPSQDFASVTHKTLLVAFYSATGQMDKMEETGEGLERMLGDWLQRIGNAKIVRLKEQPLFGSWNSFTADWSPVTGLSVGLNSAACVFAEIGKYPVAERLFRTWMDYQKRSLNDYCQALFLQSCWHNRHNRDEIMCLLSEAKNISAPYLVEIAPEMADVLKETTL